jgi:hypothetical protein
MGYAEFAPVLKREEPSDSKLFVVHPLESLSDSKRPLMEESTETDSSACAVEGRTHESGRIAFKRCTLCGTVWQRRDDFLADPTVILDGYQGSLRGLLTGRQKRGLLLFTHRIDGCGTTLACDPCDFKNEFS